MNSGLSGSNRVKRTMRNVGAGEHLAKCVLTASPAIITLQQARILAPTSVEIEALPAPGGKSHGEHWPGEHHLAKCVRP